MCVQLSALSCVFYDCHALPCMLHLLHRGWWRQGHHLEVAQPEFFVFLMNLSIDAFGEYIDFQPQKKEIIRITQCPVRYCSKIEWLLRSLSSDFKLWRWSLNDIKHMKELFPLRSITCNDDVKRRSNFGFIFSNVYRISWITLQFPLNVRKPHVWLGNTQHLK